MCYRDVITVVEVQEKCRTMASVRVKANNAVGSHAPLWSRANRWSEG